MQGLLSDAGIKIKPDGDFDSETEDAVKEFQKKNGIKTSGVADEKVWNCFQTITRIEITDDQENVMVVSVATGSVCANTWERESGSLEGVNKQKGEAITSTSDITLVGLGHLNSYRGKAGSSGNGEKSPSNLGITWKVLSVE